MKFSLFKKNKSPKLSALKPPLFNTDLYWRMSLIVYALVLAITGAVGFKLFHYGYFEGYKRTTNEESLQNLIDTTSLKSAVDKRQTFINSTTTLPADPSK